MWHPIRLAEDYAMADILTNGRVILGVGRGYHSREVETFGAPLLDTAGQQRAIRRADGSCCSSASTKRPDHLQGKYFDIPADGPYRGYQLRGHHRVPRPNHLPVEMWQPIASGKTLPI